MKNDSPYKPEFISKWTNDPSMLEGQRNYYFNLLRFNSIIKPEWIDNISPNVPNPLVKIGMDNFIRLSEYNNPKRNV